MSYIGNQSTHRGRVGKIGEDYATEFLMKRGHTILERNYRIKLGEIDIISETVDPRGRRKIHVNEVKTSASRNVRAVENMTLRKVKKVAKLAEVYSKNIPFSVNFIGVYLSNDLSLINIEFLENVEVY